jgi:plasmid stabilization system protein ParE
VNITYEPKFVNSFNNIWDYISIDSKIRANHFKSELKEKIENLVHMPYKFRKSFYFDNEEIRDMIFKGYVIPYKIDKIRNEIIIIGIKKYQENL